MTHAGRCASQAAFKGRADAARIVLRFAIALAVIPSFTSTGARAADLTRLSIESLRIGFAGHYKVGYWTPVEVALTAGTEAVRGDLEIVVPDGDGVPTRVIEHGVSLAAGEKKSAKLLVKFGRPHADIAVTLRGADGQPITERTFSGDEVPAALAGNAKSGGTKLILVLGSPLEFGSAVRFSEEGDPEETAVVHLDDPNEWPDRADAFDGVDDVVLTTGQPADFLRAPPAALDALHRWVQLGGRMVLSVGRNAPELIAAGKPLARFAPGRFKEVHQEGHVGALETFAGTEEPLNLGGDESGAPTKVDFAQLTQVRGRILASPASRPDDAPLVIRSPVGFGQLTFLAVDLDLPPISRWKARPELLAALLSRGTGGTPAAGTTEPQGQAAQYGYDDLVGQLRASLDRFQEVTFVPFWLVAILAVAYVLLLFPFDYLVGKRFVGRPLESRLQPENGAQRGVKAEQHAALPWIRFGAIVGGVAVMACFLGWHWKGSRLQTTQAAVIDFDDESGLVRGTSWSSVFSPDSRTYSLALVPQWHAPHGEPVEAQLSWLGLPGRGIGGMNAPPAELPLFTEPYDLSASSGKIDPVPLATWSSKCLTGRWIAPGHRLVAANLRENIDRQLSGTIRLADGVARSFALSRGALFYDRWAYVIDSLSADEPITIDRLEAQTAETYLTRKRVVNERAPSTPYDRSSTDPERVLEMIMFYRAAGGRRYTGLFDRYEHNLDFSDQLALGRAVLFGFGPPAAELRIDGQLMLPESKGANLTIYRIVLPVQQPSEANRTQTE
ncbi:MAG TPA: hypothetical protein VGH32_09970 [Pirellulales bacterium]